MTLNLDKLTANGVARLFGISRRQVQNLAEDGVIPKQGQFNTAHYVWDEVRDAYLRHKLTQVKPKRTTADVTGMAGAELRKLNAEATLAELKAAKLRSEVVEIEYVERCQVRIYANLRARLLAIPSRLTQQLAGKTSRLQIKSIAETEINQALAELVKIAANVAPHETEALDELFDGPR